MSAPWTYTTLLAAMQSWPVDSNPDYVADLPRIISLGELRAVRDLDLEMFEITSVVQTAIGNSALTKPTDMLVERWLRIQVGTTKHPIMKRRTMAYLEAMFPSSATADRAEPEVYADNTEAAWTVGPVPDAVYDVTVRHVARPTPLSNSNQTSWLGTHAPDVLFAACLMEADHYIKADDRYGDWRTKYYQELVPSTKTELLRLARTASLPPYKPEAQASGQ